MPVTSIPCWLDWRQDQPPCLFDRDRAHANGEYLQTALTLKWMRRHFAHANPRSHPVIALWRQANAYSFLELNSLAEDLRMVENTPGIDGVLRDLRDTRFCGAAWFTVHAAALFARAPEQRVTEFFPQDAQTRPDFTVAARHETVAVEAKRFYGSEIHDRFNSVASPIVHHLVDIVLPKDRINPLVSLLVRDPERVPDRDTISAAVAHALATQGKARRLGRLEGFNLGLEFWPDPIVGLASYACVYAYAPRSDKEILRVRDRSRRAAGQLRPLVEEGHAGILCLGLNEHQREFEVAGVLATLFAKDRFRSVSTAVILKSGAHLGLAASTYLDSVETVHNARAIVVSSRLTLQGVGSIVSAEAPLPTKDEVPVYGVGVAKGVVEANPGDVKLSSPQVRFLDRRAFA